MKKLPWPAASATGAAWPSDAAWAASASICWLAAASWAFSSTMRLDNWV